MLKDSIRRKAKNLCCRLEVCNTHSSVTGLEYKELITCKCQKFKENQFLFKVASDQMQVWSDVIITNRTFDESLLQTITANQTEYL